MLPDIHLITHVLTTPVMALAYLALILRVFLTIRRTGLTSVLVLAFSVLPWFVFYSFSWLGWFSSIEAAIAYSRIAGILAIGGLWIGISMMEKVTNNAAN